MALFVCSSVGANDHINVKYKNGTSAHYDAQYPETSFYISHYSDEIVVYDTSLYDDSRKKSRKDYDRIVSDIEARHKHAISEYDKLIDGQEVHFDKQYVSVYE